MLESRRWPMPPINHAQIAAIELWLVMRWARWLHKMRYCQAAVAVSHFSADSRGRAISNIRGKDGL